MINNFYKYSHAKRSRFFPNDQREGEQSQRDLRLDEGELRNI